MGDLGTSPLYVLPSTFAKGIKHNEDLLGILSLIYYTLTLLPIVKYIIIVLRANDNGEGGTFALYSLICRYAKVGMIPNQQAEDEKVSNYRLQLPSSNRTKIASKIKSLLENTSFAKYMLLIATMIGTSMVIGDGILTPCISESIKGAKGYKSVGPHSFFQNQLHPPTVLVQFGTSQTHRKQLRGATDSLHLGWKKIQLKKLKGAADFEGIDDSLIPFEGATVSCKTPSSSSVPPSFLSSYLPFP
ncbi:hypothetical protein PIB30_056252 [Stylosanthes scabra]|uniref:K+ potassium transporter integral membrane domain-containing protein n=1 Tax=Stylosanthes scabra TaxID=79078 RepID=A0ABU6XK03_9FABA|nr:hypothetical protein [Stylosanthes scabra]